MIIDFGTFHELDREMNRIFGNLSRPQQIQRHSYPALNLAEEDNTYIVEVAIPGIAPEAVELSLAEKELVIKYEAKSAQEREQGENAAPVRRLKDRFGSFQRVVTLNAHIDRDKVSAAAEHGILTITLPKAEKAMPVRIPIGQE